MQTIIHARPPNYAAILAAFPTAVKPGTVFSWGGRVFIPCGASLTPSLEQHEAIHGDRQGSTDASICGWWDRYIADPECRLGEELPAHIAEYRWFAEHEPRRNARRLAAAQIALRLSGPLYGRLITTAKALALVKEG